MSVNPNSSVPVYRQIGDHIRRSVAAGVYRPGEAIPSLRAMAIELQVNPNTVQRAYEELDREGLIEARKGLGMFVTTNGVASAQTKSVAAVRDTFHDGIRMGRAANISPDGIRTIFHWTWNESLTEGGKNDGDHGVQ